jgi:hypothetical protein
LCVDKTWFSKNQNEINRKLASRKDLILISYDRNIVVNQAIVNQVNNKLRKEDWNLVLVNLTKLLLKYFNQSISLFLYTA